uniref:Uncharacterized protein n=1 Tax=Arundo donax TaxID=35708 RepID=A0A0A9H3P9_ARUDO
MKLKEEGEERSSGASDGLHGDEGPCRSSRNARGHGELHGDADGTRSH